MKRIALLLALTFAFPAHAIETAAKQAIVVEDSTGTVLFTKDADAKMHPSSMSKLMTVYITFSKLKEGSLKLTDMLPVSEKAWRTQGSKTFVELGSRIAVGDLLEGIIIQSGNDACVVMAEALAGSEEAFAGQMNDMAKRLGLTNSHFANATGLPDDTHLMSARDLSILATHIIHDFPEYYHYFSQKEFEHHGIKQGNRNLLLYRDSSVDGLKTGHTDAGGFGMVASAKNNTGRRIIVVVNGLENEKDRAEEAERLLAFAFRDFESVTLLKAGVVLDKADVWFGDQPQVGLTVDKDLMLTLPKAGRGALKFTLNYDGPIPAPIAAGDAVAKLTIESAGAPPQTVPLVAAEAVERQHGFARMFHVLRYYAMGQ